jgi:arsenate reductase
MERWVVYHNPVCGQSRGALDILLEHGIEFDVVEYVKNPLNRATLEHVAGLLPNPPGDLVRKDKNFESLGLAAGDYVTRDAVIDLLLTHPVLMQRPIVVRGRRAVIARPSSRVLELVDG